MTIHALVTGTLWKDPEQRTSKSTGKAFTTATIRIKDGDEIQWIKLLAFGTDAQNELIRLGNGDALSAQGALAAQIYQPSAREARINLTLFADVVLALRAPPRPKKAKEEAPKQEPTMGAHSKSPPAQAQFDDGFPESGPWS